MYFVLEKVRIFILLLVRVLILNILFWLQCPTIYHRASYLKKIPGGSPYQEGVSPSHTLPCIDLWLMPPRFFYHLVELFKGFFLLCLSHPCGYETRLLSGQSTRCSFQEMNREFLREVKYPSIKVIIKVIYLVHLKTVGLT